MVNQQSDLFRLFSILMVFVLTQVNGQHRCNLSNVDLQLSGDQGVIRSPMLPNGKYPSLQSCSWQSSATVLLVFTSIDVIQMSSGLCEDYVEIGSFRMCGYEPINKCFLLQQSGNTGCLESARKHCSHQVLPVSYRHGEVLKFYSNARNEGSGFVMNYTVLKCDRPMVTTIEDTTHKTDKTTQASTTQLPAAVRGNRSFPLSLLLLVILACVILLTSIVLGCIYHRRKTRDFEHTYFDTTQPTMTSNTDVPTQSVRFNTLHEEVTSNGEATQIEDIETATNFYEEIRDKEANARLEEDEVYFHTITQQHVVYDPVASDQIESTTNRVPSDGLNDTENRILVANILYNDSDLSENT
uniref:Uncharacterized LOC100184052 n=1 Tax=Ciona intestinalis TaxID=7719 RepID=A0A1W5B2K3_CIOIN|nr:uncharacterized protein LOC100184052 [Ciona intestinalis]|eukprot:XP_026689771.1 uncharacterized protein LOC100184052 [Ciona intestinalis]